MKRLWVVMLVLALVPLMATPTWAEKGGIPGPPDKPDNPNDEPRVSVTCVSPWWEGDFKTGDFDIYLDRNNPDACVDVLTESAGQWEVTVTLEEGIWRKPELMMVPRDAAWADWPSDSCGGEKRVGDAVYDNPWVFLSGTRENSLTFRLQLSTLAPDGMRPQWAATVSANWANSLNEPLASASSAPSSKSWPARVIR